MRSNVSAVRRTLGPGAVENGTLISRALLTCHGASPERRMARDILLARMLTEGLETAVRNRGRSNQAAVACQGRSALRMGR